MTIAVAYLARGADEDCWGSFARFLTSYRKFPAGIDHTFHVIVKGFDDRRQYSDALDLFGQAGARAITLEDDSFDIGAYIQWANAIAEETICVLNTATEILAEAWLWKLAMNLALPNVGLVGATGSYESLYMNSRTNRSFPKFPNVHVRSTGFMMHRSLFCQIAQGRTIATKLDAFQFESGSNSLTRQVLGLGREVLLVGRNGRGYSSGFWPQSDTFRQGRQLNLLIGDNQTRAFAALPWNEKREFVVRTWGRYFAG